MNKKNEINMAKLFSFFSVSELFPNCSKDEIKECIDMHYIDTLLVLLMVLNSFREEINYPIRITSGYRGLEHNKRVNGSKTSQHLIGMAIDFQAYEINNNTCVNLFKDFLERSALSQFLGQVIFYNTFIHIGFRTPTHNKLKFYDKRKR